MKIAIYPKSNDGLVYTVLVTVPMAAAFAALLFYEWFGNEPYLADATLAASEYAAAYSTLVIVWKVGLLCYLRQLRFARSRLLIVALAFVANALVIGGYLACRFYL